jgi:hypothetical protein
MITVNDLPTTNGWYWVLIDGYNDPTPCWYYYWKSNPVESYFLPGGMGDSSSMGLFINDIQKIGPEIIVPFF